MGDVLLPSPIRALTRDTASHILVQMALAQKIKMPSAEDTVAFIAVDAAYLYFARDWLMKELHNYIKNDEARELAAHTLGIVAAQAGASAMGLRKGKINYQKAALNALLTVAGSEAFRRAMMAWEDKNN